MAGQISIGSFAKLTYNEDTVSYYKISDLYFKEISENSDQVRKNDFRVLLLIKLVSLLDDTDTKIIMVLPDSSGKNNYYTEGDNFSITFMKDLDLKTSDILLTGYPDIDINIMSNLEDSTFTALCQTDRYARSICGYERLWKMKLSNFIEMKGIRPKINPEKTSKQNYMDLKKKFSHPYMYEGNAKVFGFKASLLKSYDPEEGGDWLGKLDYGPDMNEIFEAYPEFRDKIRRGDIISDVDGDEYRSKGSYMYDGKGGLLHTFSDRDDYGGVNSEFKAFTEFLPGYWTDYEISRVGEKSGFFWYNYSAHIDFDMTLYDPSTENVYEDEYGELQHYFVVFANNMNHVVFYDPEYFEKDKDIVPITKYLGNPPKGFGGIENIGSFSYIGELW